MKKNLLSKTALLVCCLALLYEGVIFYPKWQNKDTEAVITWEVSGHYLYLPAIFVYNDLKHLGFKDSIISKYHPTPDFQQAWQQPDGNYVLKYSPGQAILFMPFFLLAHIYSSFSTEYAPDGFSFPYQLCIGFGMLFYSLLGMLLLRKLLLQFFTDGIAALTLLAIVLASNYLEYAAISTGQIQNTLFALYAGLLLFTHLFYKNPSVKKALGIGLLCGLAVLIRPAEIICIFIPLLWGVVSFRSLLNRFTSFARHLPYVRAAAGGFLLLVLIQLFYWKYASGQWMFAGHQFEYFDLGHLQLMENLFSYKLGWLVYSPVMVLALIGFVYLFINHRQMFVSVFAAVFLFVVLLFGLNMPVAGGIGLKEIVQCYALLALPMGAFFEGVYRQRKVLLAALGGMVLLFGYYNFWLIYQAHKGGLYHAGEMTEGYFWAVVGRYRADDNTLKLLDNEDLYRGTPKKFKVVYTNDFEKEGEGNLTTDNAIAGKSLFLDKDHQFSKEYDVPITASANGWLRVSADVRLTQKEWETWKMPQFAVKLYYNDWLAQTSFIRINRLMAQDGETKNISLDVQMPSTLVNRAHIYFWNAGSDKKVIIDNVKAITFDAD